MPERVGLNEIPIDLFHFLLVFDLVAFLEGAGKELFTFRVP